MSGKVTKTVMQRFMEKVNSDWQWMAHKTHGYGTFRIDDRKESAHRVSYELFNGPIPDGLCVLHDCDDPGCVNPAHLHLGTKSDNAQEREDRGRGVNNKGEAHPGAKLTDDKVREIRSLYTTGKYNHAQLAGMFNVTPSNIYLIVNNKHWKHV